MKLIVIFLMFFNITFSQTYKYDIYYNLLPFVVVGNLTIEEKDSLNNKQIKLWGKTIQNLNNIYKVDDYLSTTISKDLKILNYKKIINHNNIKNIEKYNLNENNPLSIYNEVKNLDFKKLIPNDTFYFLFLNTNSLEQTWVKYIGFKNKGFKNKQYKCYVFNIHVLESDMFGKEGDKIWIYLTEDKKPIYIKTDIRVGNLEFYLK